MTHLEVVAPDGIGEVVAGTDLAALVAEHADLHDGDVVVLTSKVVSKAEGRVVPGDRDEAIREETVRLVARRGPTSIVENHLGLVMAAAGIDASNVEPGLLVLLPLDPDATARRIREDLLARTGTNVAVLVSDTAGRAWRHGQTDLAIGAAGLEPLISFEGRTDDYGNELAVTAPAVADEITGIAEVVTGKLGGRPLCVLRGLGDLVLLAGEHGPGARSLVREAESDMFGLGSREAVVAALAGDRRGFGAPAATGDLLDALASCGFAARADDDGVLVDVAADDVRLGLLLLAHGWQALPRIPAGIHSNGSAETATRVAPLS
ncbi:coenzyme F420-0:L-glutamate ligase [Nocardioides marmorisolisilvae]|uniref:Coenzyme F420-0:L-glutamate ligase n=1 Tax=Nocardioides marmorisolisilvae TaxID=1542737 RepID=A0A3N0DSP1_9ACTN|nr:coenzyme F420-0:L-glutamate ligase [Nocardioides marmorisolisilvae]RNL78630.1 coenzyme F420-0:L-glutamate ligase [Nocardioides marmorisolisilvae]